MRKNDTYHHGHLREALLETARALVQESGVEALTLREVARRAGVSTAAPYHHFADKAELVEALAQESLMQLDQRSAAAIEQISDPREQLRAIGVAYVLYAVEHPAEFRLMFRPEIRAPLEGQELSDAPVYRVLSGVIDAGRAAGVTTVERDLAAITAWSLVHGLAALLVDGPLYALSGDPARVRALAEQVTGQLDLL